MYLVNVTSCATQFWRTAQRASQAHVRPKGVTATRTKEAQPSTTNPLPTVTLRRGLTTGMELWAWHQVAASGQLDSARKSVALIMYDTAGAPTARFWLTRAYPSNIELTALKAGSSEVLYETVTLVSDSIQRVSPS